MICVETFSQVIQGVNTITALRVRVPQPLDVTSCVMVLASPQELQPSAWNDLLTMDAATGSLIATAIAVTWVTGWAIGLARRMGTSSLD